MNIRTSISVTLILGLLSTPAFAQKLPVYAEFGLGWGKTILPEATKVKLASALGSTFEAGIGNNLHTAFYIAPTGWKGLGLGSRIKGTFGTSQPAADGDDYIFNYYNLAISAKYFPLSKAFGQGWYARSGFGFGQFTSKRINDAASRYVHQYAIGSTATFSLGYTLHLKRIGIGLEAEYETSSRNGTINGLGEATFSSGQLGGNIYISF